MGSFIYDETHSHKVILLGMLEMPSQDCPPDGRLENALPASAIKSFGGKVLPPGGQA